MFRFIEAKRVAGFRAGPEPSRSRWLVGTYLYLSAELSTGLWPVWVLDSFRLVVQSCGLNLVLYRFDRCIYLFQRNRNCPKCGRATSVNFPLYCLPWFCARSCSTLIPVDSPAFSSFFFSLFFAFLHNLL